MSDTTTITPEERAELIAHVNSGYMTISGEGLKKALKALEQAESRAEKAEAENARLQERLEAALDKIAEIQDEWEAEGVCHACGICAGIPYEWQPTDDHCCRVILDLWSSGEPLPWEAARRAVADAEREAGE